jgi:hypothetical protein
MIQYMGLHWGLIQQDTIVVGTNAAGGTTSPASGGATVQKSSSHAKINTIKGSGGSRGRRGRGAIK